MANELELQAGVKVINPVPLDPYYGPYVSQAAACLGVPLSVRAKGIRKVGIIQGDGSVVDYWWPNDQSDAGLTPFAPPLTVSNKPIKQYIDDQDAAIVTQLVDSAPANANTLNKLYALFQGLFNQKVFGTIAERNAFNVANLPFQAFVTNDGDGNWAIYQATSLGVNASYVKISDPDLLNAVQTAAQIKAAYENNPNTNAFTDDLKAALLAIVGNYVDTKNAQVNIAGDKTWTGKQTMPVAATRRIIVNGGTTGGTATNPPVYDASYIRYTPTAAGQTIQSFTTGDYGQLLFIANDGVGNLILQNSLYLPMPGGVDFVIPPGGGAVLIGLISGGASRFSVLATGNTLSTASVADLVAGTNTSKYINPQALAQFFAAYGMKMAGIDIQTAGNDERGITWAANTDYGKIFFYSTGDGHSQMVFMAGDNGTETDGGATSGWNFVKDVSSEPSMPNGTVVGNTPVQNVAGRDGQVKVLDINFKTLAYLGWQIWHEGNIDALKTALGSIGYSADQVRNTQLANVNVTSAAPVAVNDTIEQAFGKTQAQLNAVNQIKGYTLSFTAPVFEYKEYYEKAATIVIIIGDPGVATLKFSTNDGVSYTTLALPYASNILIPNATWVRWRITFNSNKTLGSVYIKFQ